MSLDDKDFTVRAHRPAAGRYGMVGVKRTGSPAAWSPLLQEPKWCTTGAGAGPAWVLGPPARRA
jgi:hypothetical protein